MIGEPLTHYTHNVAITSVTPSLKTATIHLQYFQQIALTVFICVNL